MKKNMDINKDYKQIYISPNLDYNLLRGKVVDRIGFTNIYSYDCQFLIITFTDKTFIAVGVDYNNSEGHEDEPVLENYYVLPPQNVDGGDYSVHSWVDNSGNLHFHKWVDILRDLGIWKFTDEDALEVMKRNREKEEKREYQNYLRLKGKFESNPKWLYRLEYKDDTCGLWYNGSGAWCFEKGIGSIEGCKTRDLPMGYDERYKQDGKDWFSSCSNKEDLLHWYSLEDAKRLIQSGFVFTRYLATEYHEYENENGIHKEFLPIS